MALMTDQAKIESMRLLDRAATYSYLAADQLTFLMCTTRMARWTIRYGICEKSPPAYAFLGLVMMHVMGDFKAGTWYAELAVSMLQKLEAMSSEDESQRATLMQSQSRAIFVAHGMVLYWMRQERRGKGAATTRTSSFEIVNRIKRYHTVLARKGLFRCVR